jgi:hypothetical protein
MVGTEEPILALDSESPTHSEAAERVSTKLATGAGYTIWWSTACDEAAAPRGRCAGAYSWSPMLTSS